MSFLDELVRRGLLSPNAVGEIAEEVTRSDEPLDKVLGKHGVDEEKIISVRSEYLNIPIRRVVVKDTSFEVLKYISEEAAVNYRMVPLSVEGGTLEIGMVDPENISARDALQFIASRFHMPYKVFLITESDFKLVAENYKGLTSEVEKAVSEIDADLSDSALEDDIRAVEDISRSKDRAAANERAGANLVEEAPVTKIVAVVLRHAIEGGASDIHIENGGDQVRVRYRVDGVLHTSITLPIAIYSAVVARVKVLCSLKLDEKRKPQDGRFSAKIDGRKIDFRVSTFPTYYGEKVVMRILDSHRGLRKLEEIGLSKRDVSLVREALAKPYGMILITGPTGSGKTTTLYSMLNEIDREKENVVSLEDPIEYNMPNMSQSQVVNEIGYTFASGLRSILRQDPDTIMVGEIRDRETAELAIQAALTGHLVFSTLHTNNAAGVIPRLIDMGVEPYLIAPTLNIAIAQRLVATICKGAASPMPEDEAHRVLIEKQFADLPEEFRRDIPLSGNLHEAKATSECPSGMRGRMPVFEMFSVTKEIEHAILHNPTEAEILKVARSQGMTYMREDALVKCFQGLVPFSEVNTL